MKVEIAERWLRALQGSAYEPAKNQLRTATGYCCLGVLCDLYHNETGKGEWRKPSAKTWWVFQTDYVAERNYLPQAVQDWAGLTCRNPMGLSVINDSEGWPAVIHFLSGYIAAKRDDNI